MEKWVKSVKRSGRQRGRGGGEGMREAANYSLVHFVFCLLQREKKELVCVSMLLIPDHLIAYNFHFSVWCTRVTVYMYVEL